MKVWTGNEMEWDREMTAGRIGCFISLVGQGFQIRVGLFISLFVLFRCSGSFSGVLE